MRDESDPYRDKLHTALQDIGPSDRPGALLTGWALVTQWVDTDGETYLARVHSETIPTWTANGMWHEALYGDWGSE
jgi:hypothetical protein